MFARTRARIPRIVRPSWRPGRRIARGRVRGSSRRSSPSGLRPTSRVARVASRDGTRSPPRDRRGSCAESPADVRGDDVNQMFRIFQHDRKDEAVDERILRRDVESELPRARFELRNRGPRLHRRSVAGRWFTEPLAHDDVGFPEDLVDIPPAKIHLNATLSGASPWSGARPGFVAVSTSVTTGRGSYSTSTRSPSVFRDEGTLGDDDRHGFSRVPDDLPSERRIRGRLQVRVRDRPCGNDVADLVLHILGCEDIEDSGKASCLRRVDRTDSRMRIGTSDELCENGPGREHVRHEIASAGEEPVVFLAEDGLAEHLRRLGAWTHPFPGRIISPAAATESTMLEYPVQRQMFPDIAVRIRSSDGAFSTWRSSRAASTTPGVQNPHWRPWCALNASESDGADRARRGPRSS